MANIQTNPTLRLESAKRLVVLNYLGDKFELIQGPRTGRIKKEVRGYEPDSHTARTANQVTLINLVKLANAKIAAGYTVVKGSVQELNDEVAKYTTLAKEAAIAEKEYRKAWAAGEKLAKRVAKTEAAYNAALEEWNNTQMAIEAADLKRDGIEAQIKG